MVIRIVLVLLLGFFAFGSPVIGQEIGGISITPTRVVFEGRDRSAEVIILNRSTKSKVFRVSFKNMAMGENGRYHDVDKQEGQALNMKFADQMIRYSPRQITVSPQSSQVVRLMARKPRDLKAGEYRSHLLLQALPPRETGKSIESLKLKEGEIALKLVPRLGISLPVIIRQGKTDVAVTVKNPVFKPADPSQSQSSLTLDINRSGNQSAFGDVVVTFKSNTGKTVEVGRLSGVAVFTPNTKRVLKIKLYPPNKVKIEKGKLLIVYKKNEKDGGDVYSTASISLP